METDAVEREIETIPPSLVAELKELLQEDDGENAVRAKVNGILSRRGTSNTKQGEQMALMAAMDELEEDQSDEAGRVLNIIFGCSDASLLKVEQQFPLKKSVKPADETPQSVADITFEAIAKTVPQDDDGDDEWGPTDINGDSWDGHQPDDRPKTPDCDD